jgi:hypothetical protein
MSGPLSKSSTHADFNTILSTPHWEELSGLYDRYRDYMKHEDDLINQRSSWHLLLQGFLFATFGVMGEWQAGDDKGFLHPQRFLILYGLVVMGFLISIFASFSILAANTAINRLQKQWDDLPRKLNIPESFCQLLPGLAGGGSNSARLWGKSPAIAIPFIVALAWLWVLGVAIHSQKSLSHTDASITGAQISGHRTMQSPSEKTVGFVPFTGPGIR